MSWTMDSEFFSAMSQVEAAIDATPLYARRDARADQYTQRAYVTRYRTRWEVGCRVYIPSRRHVIRELTESGDTLAEAVANFEERLSSWVKAHA